MQEVVDVPGLVADHQVVVRLLDDLVEDHEVVDQDLVHPADRLEGVQVVLGALVLDVRGLVGQPLRGGVHRLAGGREHPGDRVLREPVDLEVGVPLAQLGGDGEVAARVAEADRGGEVERPLGAALRPDPGPRRCQRSASGCTMSANSLIRWLMRTGSRAGGA